MSEKNETVEPANFVMVMVNVRKWENPTDERKKKLMYMETLDLLHIPIPGNKCRLDTNIKPYSI